MSTRLAEEGRLKALNQRAERRGRDDIAGDCAPTKVSSQRVLASLWLMLSSAAKVEIHPTGSSLLRPRRAASATEIVRKSIESSPARV